MAAVTASFPNRQEAEAARGRLVGGGLAVGPVAIEEPAQGGANGAGIFDQLAGFLAPGKSREPSDYIVRAEVESKNLEAAAFALEPDERRNQWRQDRTYEFVETAEELVIEKELFVREEVVLQTIAEEHVEQINETVRRTEVAVERIEPGEPVT